MVDLDDIDIEEIGGTLMALFIIGILFDRVLIPAAQDSIQEILSYNSVPLHIKVIFPVAIALSLYHLVIITTLPEDEPILKSIGMTVVGTIVTIVIMPTIGPYTVLSSITAFIASVWLYLR